MILGIRLRPLLDTVSATYVNKGKGPKNTPPALLSLLKPTAVPIRSLWGLLASLHLSVSPLTGHPQHVHLHPSVRS